MTEAKLLHGDNLSILKTLPNGFFRTCVTSPPYYGLRDYGVEGQIGLEQTPEEYISRLVEVFREVWRVLSDDGTLWLNLGDSYASPIKGTGGNNPEKSPLQSNKGKENFQAFTPRKFNMGYAKQKDLMMIPARTAIALQMDGWYLRSEIVWAKPNPMPESVRDRPTKSHEMIYLLAKNPKYYYDANAVKEKSVSSGARGGNLLNDTKKKPNGGKERWKGERKLDWGINGRNRRDVWLVATRPYKEAHFATFPPDLIEPCILAGSAVGDYVLDPFNGSGTTGAVALQHSRNYYGIDLNEKYLELSRKRIAQVQERLMK